MDWDLRHRIVAPTRKAGHGGSIDLVQRPSRSEAKVQGNEEDGIHFVCLACQHNERSYAAIERHATQQHPTRAVRIEQTGLTR